MAETVAARDVGGILETIRKRLDVLEERVRALVRQNAGARFQDFQLIDSKLLELPFQAGQVDQLEAFFSDEGKRAALFIHLDTLMRPMSNCHFIADVTSKIFTALARYTHAWPTKSPNAAKGKIPLPKAFCSWAEDIVCRQEYATAEFRKKYGCKSPSSVLAALRYVNYNYMP